MSNVKFIHEITLPGEDEFSKRFNYVSWLFSKATDETLPEDKQKYYQDEYFTAKLSLEQGYPISFLNEYNPLKP